MFSVWAKNLLTVNIEPDHQIAVRVGQNQTILCQAPVPLRNCRFLIPNEESLSLSPDQPDDGIGIEYYGSGLQNGQCGVKISSIKATHDGNVSCFLTPVKGRSESSNSVRLVVASKSKVVLHSYTYNSNVVLHDNR